jgi:hypothetical protein
MSKLEVDAIEPQSGTTLTLGASGDSVNIASGATITDFTSTGIDDNATSNAITIESTERVQFTRPRSNTLGDSALEIKPSDTVIGYGFRIDQATNSFIIEKSSPSASEAERMRIDSSGNVGIGTSSPTAFAGYTNVVANNSSGSMFELMVGGTRTANIQTTASITNIQTRTSIPIAFDTNTSERMRIDTAGNLLIGRTDNPSGVSNSLYVTGVYNLTSGSGANVFVSSEGRLMRSTSSLRYKNTIENTTHGLTELLKLRPITYKGNTDGDKIYGGLIAEEVHEAGLTEFVEYNENGQPDALAYGNMVSICIKAIQEQQTKIQELEARITTLEANNP